MIIISLLGGKYPDVIPDSWHSPIVQKGAAITASKNKEAADRFLIFLKSPAARALFAKYGFGPSQTPGP